MQHVGYLRHLLLRRGDQTGEILVNLVTTTQEEHDLSLLVDALLALQLEGKIVGILHILNDSLSDVVQSDETRILYGQDFSTRNCLIWTSKSHRFHSSSQIQRVRRFSIKP